jgi:hypothetical protein
MALGGNQITKNPESTAAHPPPSEVTAEEKQLLYRSLKHRRPQRTIDRRIAVFILAAAAFGFLAAVFAIRLFPM